MKSGEDPLTFREAVYGLISAIAVRFATPFELVHDWADAHYRESRREEE